MHQVPVSRRRALAFVAAAAAGGAALAQTPPADALLRIALI